jgi:NAD-dependent SIR2 family protein deacetylase
MAQNANTSTGKNIGVQFTKNGPSIPIKLLQSLEDGQLVIFCGAGVSRCCGLPDFGGLVEEVCAQLRHPMEANEQELFKNKAFDVLLGVLEKRFDKTRLRNVVRGVLDIRHDSDLTTHEALLQLATSKEGRLRLVTTNFDRAFELAQYSGNRTFDYAPYLPLPGRSWNSIVHVHGGLGNPRDSGGESLVLTSADFGRAYNTDGWASRFLTELFRRTEAVLFIG